MSTETTMYLMAQYLTFIRRFDMAKEKLTDETLLDKCSNEKCMYNKRNFCLLHNIMLDEEGKCIYNKQGGNENAGES